MRSLKQQILDNETTNVEDWIQQQLLINCTKTEIGAINRALRRLDKILYKTGAKEAPLSLIKIQSESAEIIIKQDETSD